MISTADDETKGSLTAEAFSRFEIGMRVIEALRAAAGPLQLKRSGEKLRDCRRANCHRYVVSFVRTGFLNSKI